MTQILFIVDIKPFENKGHKELPQAGLHGLFHRWINEIDKS
jgi:hypothetical protein